MVLEIPTKAEWHWGRTSKLSRHLQLLTIGENLYFFVFHLSKHNATPCPTFIAWAESTVWRWSWMIFNVQSRKGSFLRSFIQTMSFKLKLIWELKANKKKRRQRHPAPPIDTSRGDPRFVPTRKKKERKRLGQLTSSDSFYFYLPASIFPRISPSPHAPLSLFTSNVYSDESRDPITKQMRKKPTDASAIKIRRHGAAREQLRQKSGVGRWDGPLESAMRRN